jgi:IMP dehydrogenase
LLLPQYSTVVSRKYVDLEQQLDSKNNLRIPIISSPMDTVTGPAMAQTMSDMGGLGIIHRYNTIEEQVAMARNVAGPVGAQPLA